MIAEILTIGDEVLRGEIVDSNKARIAQRLLDLDIECCFQTSVRDHPADMREALLLAAKRCDVILVSGGLGPTRDDMTTAVVAETFGRELFLDDASLERVRSFYRSTGREMPETNRKQAFFPVGADVLENPIGTAPGFALEVPKVGCEGVSLIYCMPGVPRELDRMLEEQVLPRLSQANSRDGIVRVVRTRFLRTFGLGESSLEEELQGIARDGDVELGFRTAFPDNFLRPIARAATAAEADAKVGAVADEIHDRLGALVYAEGDVTMEALVGSLMTREKKTVATAESCTGGLIAERITDVPGSSAYFLGAVVAYSNEIKARLLGVEESLLAEHGAVSEPVVRAMAEGVRDRFGSDYGVATSGISGPDGGTPEKPVGLVHLALAGPGGTHSDHFVFPIDRSRHRLLASQVALDWLRRSLIGAELVGPSLLRGSRAKTVR